MDIRGIFGGIIRHQRCPKYVINMHKWRRAMARTLLAKYWGFPPEVIEYQLAHAVPDTLGTKCGG
jgi:hypothetical protein